MTASNASGQLIFLPLLAWIATTYSWRWTAAAVVIAAVGLVIPLAIVFLRHSPAEIGILPYGATEAPDAPPPRMNPFRNAVSTLREFAPRRDFQLLVFAFFVCGATTNGLIGTHLIAACADHGFTEVQGAGLLAAIGVFDVIGTITSGWLTDRYDPRWLLFWYYGLRGISLLGLNAALNSAGVGLAAFVIFDGLDWVATVPPTIALCRKIAGVERVGVVFAWVFCSHQLGAAFAAWGAGFSRSWLGTYEPAFLISGATGRGGRDGQPRSSAGASCGRCSPRPGLAIVIWGEPWVVLARMLYSARCVRSLRAEIGGGQDEAANCRRCVVLDDRARRNRGVGGRRGSRGEGAPASAKRHDPARSLKHAPQLHRSFRHHHRGDQVVVMVREGASPQTVLARHRLQARLVYRAIGGLITRVTARQQARLAADRDVVMVAPLAMADPGTPYPPLEAPPGTPHLYEFPQFVPWGVERVGGLLSPTAHIDGIDQRVDADVAVLDSGVEPLSDLPVAGGVDCLGGKAREGLLRDTQGHGTPVAGAIAALDNSFGVVGIAPGARIWSVRVLPVDDVVRDADLLCGVDWVAEHASVIDVANVSLSGLFEDGWRDDATGRLSVGDYLHLAICRAVARSVTFVVAAGNDSLDAALTTPASYDEVIAVSALSDSDGKPGGSGAPTCLDTADDVFAFFSNFGLDIDIAAPGVCVETTYPGDGPVHRYRYELRGAIRGRGCSAPASDPSECEPGGGQGCDPRQSRVVRHAGDPDGINEGVLNVAGF